MKVYLALDWNTIGMRFYPMLGLGQFHILVSAATLWQKTGGRRFWDYDMPPHRELILDSGAFSLLSSMSDYPYSLEDYLAVAVRHRADLVAARDWPCEPWGKIKVPVPERIARTVEADVRICDAPLPDGVRPLPVIQGWFVEDYLSCIDQIRERGALRDTMAVGSCCKRSSIRDVMDIARAIRAELPRTRLHYFGLKIQAMKQPGFGRLADSVDTGAWSFVSGGQYYPWADGKCSFCGKPQEYNGKGHLHNKPASSERMHRLYSYLPRLQSTQQTDIEGYMQ